MNEQMVGYMFSFLVYVKLFYHYRIVYRIGSVSA